MDKKIFDRYADMRREIQRLKRDDCVVSDVVRGSAPESPYTAHSVRVTGVDQQKLNFNRERIKRLEKACSEVEAAIACAPNTLAEAMTIKYTASGTWETVAAACRMHPDTIRKQVEKYIASI